MNQGNHRLSLKDIKPSSYLPLHLKPHFEERNNTEQDVNNSDCSQCPGNSCEKLSDALDSCKVESNDVHRIEQKSDNNDNEQEGRHATVEKKIKMTDCILIKGNVILFLIILH